MYLYMNCYAYVLLAFTFTVIHTILIFSSYAQIDGKFQPWIIKM